MNRSQAVVFLQCVLMRVCACICNCETTVLNIQMEFVFVVKVHLPDRQPTTMQIF